MRRMLTIDEEILINQFTQELISIDIINDWFDNHDLINKKDIVFNLLNMVIQSHPTYDELESSAIELKKIKSSVAVKLLNKNRPYNKFGYEICNLPEKDLKVGFNILLLTLTKADNRRKQQEKGACNHWWHKDLSDEKYLETIRRQFQDQS